MKHEYTIYTDEELANCKFPCIIHTTCPSCNKEFSKEIRTSTKKKNLLCPVCNTRNGKLLQTPEQRISIEQKRKETCIKKYGSLEAFYKQVGDKYKKTCLERYGVENSFQLPEVIAKIHTPEINKKRSIQTQQALLKKYGTNTFCTEPKCREALANLSTDERKQINNKVKQTKEQRYGDANYNNLKKHEETCLKKYGVSSFSQTSLFAQLRTKKYYYDNESFDSLPELALWVYAKDHDEPIIHNPIKLEYSYEGKTHYYFPDFLYKGQLIEIKGDHFIKDGILVNPFDSSQNGLYAQKYYCGIANNVVFWASSDYKFALDYLKNKETSKNEKD